MKKLISAILLTALLLSTCGCNSVGTSKNPVSFATSGIIKTNYGAEFNITLQETISGEKANEIVKNFKSLKPLSSGQSYYIVKFHIAVTKLPQGESIELNGGINALTDIGTSISASYLDDSESLRNDLNMQYYKNIKFLAVGEVDTFAIFLKQDASLTCLVYKDILSLKHLYYFALA